MDPLSLNRRIDRYLKMLPGRDTERREPIHVFLSGPSVAEDVPPEHADMEAPGYCSQTDQWIDTANGDWRETSPGSGVRILYPSTDPAGSDRL